MAHNMIVYDLHDPGFTIYHRAAMGGLAATVRAWNKQGVSEPLVYECDPASGAGTLSDAHGNYVKVALSSSHVSISWSESTSARRALALLLSASFERTKDGMIYLPGQGFDASREDVLFATHNALLQTFLQHNKTRSGPKETREVALLDEDSGHPLLLTYKKVQSYSHQVARGTDLLGPQWTVEDGDLPETARIPQSLMPGATGGASELCTSPTLAFLLTYLIVACPLCVVRSRKRGEKTQSCLVVPDVIDLKVFARRLHRVGTSQLRRFSNTYLWRVVGGAEEAALRFLIDLKGEDLAEELGVSNFHVVAMGKVAWDKKQQNRSWIARVRADLDEVGVFEAAVAYLGRTRVIRGKKGESFTRPASPVPELVAANLACGDDWYAHFRELVAKKRDFVSMLYQGRGLRAMRDAVQSQDDQLIIRCFQEAWKAKRIAFSQRADAPGLGAKEYWRLVEVERERMRNDILRCKTVDVLTNWLLRFAADSSRAQSLDTFATRSRDLHRILFYQRGPDRIQNLLLFALVSSTSLDPTGRFQPPKSEE